MFPVECVARGYLTGSGLREYADTGAVCGIALPDGLVDGSRLVSPLFTPATKAELGDHDENVSYDVVAGQVGEETASRLRDLTLAVYGRAEEVARERGIILADTKFEFGARPDGTIVLADEVLTPDSSRFWPAEEWSPGRAQPSFDKDVRARLADLTGERLGPHLGRGPAAAAGRGRRADPVALHRGLRAADRPHVLERRIRPRRLHDLDATVARDQLGAAGHRRARLGGADQRALVGAAGQQEARHREVAQGLETGS